MYTSARYKVPRLKEMSDADWRLKAIIWRGRIEPQGPRYSDCDSLVRRMKLIGFGGFVRELIV
jgi:hypothetical protein